MQSAQSSSQSGKRRTRTAPCPRSRRRDDDRLRARREAEAVVEASATGGELVAAPAAPAAVAEPDVVRRAEAVRVRRVQACCAAVVHRAGSAANVLGTGGAVRDHGVLRGARREGVGRLADKGEFSVGGREPVHHGVVAEEPRGGL